MGKLDRIVLLLILLIAIVSPPVAVKVRDIMNKQEEEINGLTTDVEETQEKLQITEEEKKAVEDKLDTEKRERAKVRRKLDLAEQKLISVQDEITGMETELNKCVIEKTTLEEELKQFTEGEAGLAEKVAELTEELSNLKMGFTDIDIEGNGDLETDTNEGEALPERGRIEGIYGNRLLTISLNGKIGNVTSPTFVYRRGKVLGKVTLNKIHSARVVIEVEESELLENISEGDVVELEGEEMLLRPELFEGRVVATSRHDFVTIEVATPAHMIRQPSFVMYQGDEAVGTIKSTRIVYLVVVAELGGVKRRMRIAPKDYFRTPR